VAVNLVLTGALVLHRVEFPRIAMPLTATWAVLFLWVGAASGLILACGGLSKGLGWLGVGTVAYTLGVLAFIMRDPDVRKGTSEPSKAAILAGAPVLILLPAWFVWLGFAL
jgi:hypothetical protein